jgi:hypothetical protein
MQNPTNKIAAEKTVKIHVFKVTIGNNTVMITAVSRD